jgi:ABC-type transport system substrate-binding protein
MVAQFEAGSLGMILNPPLRDIARLKTDPQYQAVTNPNTGRYYTAGWNVGTGPLSNKLVRQALNFAMNRQRLLIRSCSGSVVRLPCPGFPRHRRIRMTRPTSSNSI